MGNVPSATSCPVAVVVILVPSQAAACDTVGAENVLPLRFALFIQTVVSFENVQRPLPLTEAIIN